MFKLRSAGSIFRLSLRDIIDSKFSFPIHGKTMNPHNRDMTFKRFTSGMPGSGAGKGGGAGGSVRESGGRLGEYGAAQEEHYFFNKQKEQLEKLKKKQKSEKAGEMTHKEEK